MPTATSSLLRSANVTVFVSDLDRSLRFYTNLLGFAILYSAAPHFAMIELNGFKVGLHPHDAHTPDAPNQPGIGGGLQIGLDVAGPIEQAVDAMSRRGVTFQRRKGAVVVDDGPVKLAFFEDPDGHVLYLCEPQAGSAY